LPLEVIAAVVFGAFLHASWNAIVKSGGDAFQDVVLVTAGAAGFGAVAIAFLPPPLRASWPFIAASVVVHVGYFSLVAAAYRVGDLSHAYPLMRGAAPLVVALTSGALVAEFPPPLAWGGILLICSGVYGLGRASGRPPGRAPTGATVLALATALVIAAYTFVDGIGARRSGHPISYAAWIFVLTAAPLLGWAVLRGRAQVTEHLLRRWYVAPVGGLCTAGSYGLALWAMTRAPIASVAALRETSILFGIALAATVLKEQFGVGRIAAASCIALGVVLLRLA
jgi:drug/metabolite transporter (DMT)-like permease